MNCRGQATGTTWIFATIIILTACALFLLGAFLLGGGGVTLDILSLKAKPTFSQQEQNEVTLEETALTTDRLLQNAFDTFLATPITQEGKKQTMGEILSSLNNSITEQEKIIIETTAQKQFDLLLPKGSDGRTIWWIGVYDRDNKETYYQGGDQTTRCFFGVGHGSDIILTHFTKENEIAFCVEAEVYNTWKKQ